ncbi:hypothetical protein DINM_003255 [Dirofilaria immitis]|nr:hypothetical protein [Dirofilaria immitis]
MVVDIINYKNIYQIPIFSINALKILLKILTIVPLTTHIGSASKNGLINNNNNNEKFSKTKMSTTPGIPRPSPINASKNGLINNNNNNEKFSKNKKCLQHLGFPGRLRSNASKNGLINNNNNNEKFSKNKKCLQHLGFPGRLRSNASKNGLINNNNNNNEKFSKTKNVYNTWDSQAVSDQVLTRPNVA